MRTQQKTNCTLFLIFGLIFSLGSCSKITDYSRRSTYEFINNTDYSITQELGFEKYNVAANSRISVSFDDLFYKKNASIEDYRPPFSGLGRSLTLKFDGVKCLTMRDELINSPSNIKSYQAEKLGDNNYKFTYTFTEADYNRAVACP